MLGRLNANVEMLETAIIKSGDTVTIEVIDLLQPEFSFTRTIPADTISAGTIKTECL
jgi:hypothetical protein